MTSVTKSAGGQAGNYQLADSVEQALKDAVVGDAVDSKRKMLFVGLSPTGGGHTDRTINIIKQAAGNETLNQLPKLGEGSTVVMHVAELWSNKTRSGIENLAKFLAEKKINLVAVEDDKSVVGYLQEGGQSDDVQIVDRLSTQARRNEASWKYASKRRGEGTDKLLDAVMLTGNGDARINEGDGRIDKLPVMSAKTMFESLSKILGAGEDWRKHVMVLTDMAPHLQKAAKEADIPENNRLDQQNHGLLLDEKLFGSGLENMTIDEITARYEGMSPKDRKDFAYFAKVIGGLGEKVSHIDLGGKNTLGEAHELAKTLGITNDTSKEEARKIVVGKLIAHGNAVDLGKDVPEGVIYPENADAENINNIVCVYAHAKTKGIAEHIKNKINEEPYNNTVFVFCGSGAVTNGEKYDALKLGYIAGADMMTTCGAGTNGEFAYLSRAANSDARLLALPIKGHNEQETNANKMESILNKDGENKSVYVSFEVGDALHPEIDSYIENCNDNIREKYGSGKKMGAFMSTTKSEDTYVQQAVDEMFDRSETAPTTMSDKLRHIEQIMRDDPLLEANRHFLKLAFQTLEDVEKHIDEICPNDDSLVFKDEIEKGAKIVVKYGANNGNVWNFSNFKEVNYYLNEEGSLLGKLGVKSNGGKLKHGETINEDSLVMLKETKALFNKIASGSIKKSDAKKLIREWKEEVGEKVITGF